MQTGVVDLSAIIQTLGLSGMGIAALVFLARSLLQHRLTKDADAFKSDLARSTQIEIEKIKSNFALELQKQIVQFSALNGRRADLLADIYSKVEELDTAVNTVRLAYLPERSEEVLKSAASEQPMLLKNLAVEREAALNKALDTIVALTKTFFPNRIWVSEQTEELYLTLIRHNLTLMRRLRPKSAIQQLAEMAPGRSEQDAKELAEAKEQLDEAAAALRYEFRQVLGVAN